MFRVCHFEINSKKPEEAVEFYSHIFNWTIQKKWTGTEDYWLIHTGRSDESGINGGIKRCVLPNPGTITCVKVNSIDETAAKITQHGGKLISEKISIPETGYLLYCQDPEGNPFSIIEKSGEAQ